MFTSRAEYRLMLREDNADDRLTPTGARLGLVSEDRRVTFEKKREAVAQEEQRLRTTYVSAGFQQKHSLDELLRRPEITYASLMQLPGAGAPVSDPEVATQVETRIKYRGYIERQREEVARHSQIDERALPPGLDYRQVRGLSAEVQQKLNQHRPETIGQASRISGVTPAAISLLLVHLKRGFQPHKRTA
jgi:tRNA uridine 5-carboxymethylaminomethyl modification enzyme